MSCILPGPFFNSPFVHTKSPHFKQHSKYEGSLKTKYALANKYTTPKKRMIIFFNITIKMSTNFLSNNIQKY